VAVLQCLEEDPVMTATERASEDQRNHMVAEAAYFLAEHRGFDGGDPVADWLQAEAEVDARLGGGQRLLERLEERVATVDQRLEAARKRVAGMKTEVREEWQRDVDRLARLRTSLRRKLTEMRKQGEDVGEKAREQVEKTWLEASEVLHRLERRGKRARK
jgi:hypothetical protein